MLGMFGFTPAFSRAAWAWGLALAVTLPAGAQTPAAVPAAQPVPGLVSGEGGEGSDDDDLPRLDPERRREHGRRDRRPAYVAEADRGDPDGHAAPMAVGHVAAARRGRGRAGQFMWTDLRPAPRAG